nr:hypothetical protein [Pandoravirus aubagnensis]
MQTGRARSAPGLPQKASRPAPTKIGAKAILFFFRREFASAINSSFLPFSFFLTTSFGVGPFFFVAFKKKDTTFSCFMHFSSSSLSFVCPSLLMRLELCGPFFPPYFPPCFVRAPTGYGQKVAAELVHARAPCGKGIVTSRLHVHAHNKKTQAPGLVAPFLFLEKKKKKEKREKRRDDSTNRRSYWPSLSLSFFLLVF